MKARTYHQIKQRANEIIIFCRAVKHLAKIIPTPLPNVKNFSSLRSDYSTLASQRTSVFKSTEWSSYSAPWVDRAVNVHDFAMSFISDHWILFASATATIFICKLIIGLIRKIRKVRRLTNLFPSAPSHWFTGHLHNVSFKRTRLPIIMKASTGRR